MTKHDNSWKQRDLVSVLHGFSHLPTLRKSGPHVIERGEGIYVYDQDGRRLIEGNSGLWNVVTGFDDRRLVEAAYEQMRRLPAYHAFFGRIAGPSIELAEKLLEIAPAPMGKVFFTNSGSEANDTFVKLLWMINRAEGNPRKRKIITRRNAFHGTTVMASSLTGKDYVQAFGLPLPETPMTDCPHYWRYGRAGESERDFNGRLAANLEQLIVAEGPETIAGFIAEPVMGAGGVIPPPDGYFQEIQAVLRQYGIPLVADEVICGFGRTGALWGCETYRIEPDIMVASKCITCGYFPMGAVIVSQEIADRLSRAAEAYEEFPHGFTSGGHPVGAAIALKAIEIITEGGVLDNVRRVAPRFQKRLKAFAEHPLVGEARGVGLMGALEIVADKARKEPFAASANVSERIALTAVEHGLIIRPIGGAVVFAPPFIISEAQIDDMFDRVEAVLDRVADVVVPV